MASHFPSNDRPIIGHCEVCGGEIYGSTEEFYSDAYYDFEGELVHEDCLKAYCDERFHRGGIDED